jgi:putative FmdB family regulatory protein
MPTYDYHCETCGIDFEIAQSFSEETLTRCPTKKSGRSPEGCISSGRGKVVKIFSAPGITFKGTGFYKNDSRNGSKSSSSSTASETTSPASSSDSSTPAAAPASPKSDTKPEKKSSTTSAKPPAD